MAEQRRPATVAPTSDPAPPLSEADLRRLSPGSAHLASR